jgi:predicted amidohydrolase
MIISAAQFEPYDEDIEQNLSIHYDLIEQAAALKSDLILFPELALTGYLREKSTLFEFSPNDKRLDILKNLAEKHEIVIITEAPLKLNNSLYIGAFIIKPDRSIEKYIKQYLHHGEEIFYQSTFDNNPIIKIESEKISIAICSDIHNSKHPENAMKNETTIYLASLFFSDNGIEKGHIQLQDSAQRYSMNILMSNFCGKSYQIKAGGKSAFWNDKGKLITMLGEHKKGLIVLEKQEKNWNILRNY